MSSSNNCNPIGHIALGAGAVGGIWILTALLTPRNKKDPVQETIQNIGDSISDAINNITGGKKREFAHPVVTQRHGAALRQ